MNFNRREFLKLGTMGAIGLMGGMAHPSIVNAQVTPRSTAKTCIFVMLKGGPSHIDTFDFKEGNWTPKDFNPTKLSNGMVLPAGLFPKLSAKSHLYSVVRSISAYDALHERAQYYLATAHQPNPGLVLEIPHMGSIVALEKPSLAGDFLPPFISIDTQLTANNGFLPARFAGFPALADLGVPNLNSSYDKSRQERRWQLLQSLDSSLRSLNSDLPRDFADYNDFYSRARDLMTNSSVSNIFQVNNTDLSSYGSSSIGRGLAIAKNLVLADKGVRYIFVTHSDWDLHNEIYNKKALQNLYKLSTELDQSLSALLDDLSAAQIGGKSALDQTLIVTMGEFGRTPGDLSKSNGREHFKDAHFALFAGGGVQGGRVLGSTDSQGAKITDLGWQYGRPIYFEDVAVTIYSALGINWTKTISETPSGRKFYYIEFGELLSKEISELFI